MKKRERIVEALRQGYLPAQTAQELGRKLGMRHAKVWNILVGLEREGIVFVYHRGPIGTFWALADYQ